MMINNVLEEYPFIKWLTIGYLGWKFLKILSSKDEGCSLFISHSWKHDKHYNKLVSKLEDNNLKFNDLSINKNNPFCVEDREHLLYCLEKQIAKSDKVLVFAGGYVSYSETIKDEIRIAKKLGKEIIAVKPWGAKRIPKYIQENATQIIGNYTPNILNKIES